MSWAQYAKAFQEHLETGDGLISGLSGPLVNEEVSPTGGADSCGFKLLESVPLPTLFNFQRTVCRAYNIFRSSPTDS